MPGDERQREFRGEGLVEKGAVDKLEVKKPLRHSGASQATSVSKVSETVGLPRLAALTMLQRAARRHGHSLLVGNTYAM